MDDILTAEGPAGSLSPPWYTGLMVILLIAAALGCLLIGPIVLLVEGALDVVRGRDAGRVPDRAHPVRQAH